MNKKSIDSLRVLSVDMINKANSGHPGICLGAAPMSYVLFTNHLRVNPNNPNYFNRDRFVLSAGHGSALLYSLLHLSGFDLTLDDLKQFRQLDSRTPGHPEFGHTAGVDATSGPLGQGIATAVGMAIAESHLAAKYNKEDFALIDHYTYTLVGDGDLMEGVSSEASSLAGHLQLGKLIALYDSNLICLDGDTKDTFTEDVKKRYESYGWHVVEVENGDEDLAAINQAITQAKTETTKPSMIIVKTTIGYQSEVAGKSAAHGSPLGEQKTNNWKQLIGWKNDPFVIDEDVYEDFKINVGQRGQSVNEKWDKLFNQYAEKYPEDAKQLAKLIKGEINVERLVFNEKELGIKEATRQSGEDVLNQINGQIPNLLGGSADLFSSTKNYLKASKVYSPESRDGKNIYFGVREFAMGAIANGISLHGGLIAQVSTFFVFSDYVKAAIRLSAIQNQPVIYIFTHDSIAVGEDGPTHEPVEQLTGLRAIPNLHVYRPADYNETINAYKSALASKTSPSAIILTRQNVTNCTNATYDQFKQGAYIIKDAQNYDCTIIATGSEVELAIQASELLSKKGYNLRIVNMTENKLFDQQDEKFKEQILGEKLTIAIEMGSTLGWYKYADFVYGIDSFGASGKANEVFEKFGFTAEKFANYIVRKINK